MAKERWKPIVGHPGYEVSDHGRVRSLDRVVVRKNGTTQRVKGRLLKDQPFSNGYRFVHLGGKAHLIHRLVGEAFVPSFDTRLDINHKNGLRADNFFKNLEGATRSANVKHSYDLLGRKPHGKTTPVVVGGIRYPSELAAANAIGRSVGSVHSALVKNHLCAGKEVSRA